MEDRRDNQFHLELARELGGINQRLSGIDTRLGNIENHLATQNGRIRKLEDWNLKMKTQTGVIAAVISAGFSLLIIGLNKYL